jgi:hypothetical protein
LVAAGQFRVGDDPDLPAQSGRLVEFAFWKPVDTALQ